MLLKEAGLFISILGRNTEIHSMDKHRVCDVIQATQTGTTERGQCQPLTCECVSPAGSSNSAQWESSMKVEGNTAPMTQRAAVCRVSLS